jgi:hypothetical protein
VVRYRLAPGIEPDWNTGVGTVGPPTVIHSVSKPEHQPPKPKGAGNKPQYTKPKRVSTKPKGDETEEKDK